MNKQKFKSTIQVPLPDNRMKENSNRRLGEDRDKSEEGKEMCISERVIRSGQK